MAINVKSYKKKIHNQKPSFNLVPFIDILFTILIFLVVTSNFSAEVTGGGAESGKPELVDSSGNSEYYIVPVANLNKVIVNGQDMSHLIRNNAIGVQSNVIDQGEISIKPGKIIITTPPNIPVDVAVQAPE